jgi:hypothetical protein
LRVLIAGGPAIVVGMNASQHPRTRLGRKEPFVAPLFSEGARQVRMIHVGNQPPSGFRLQTKHRASS